MIYIYIYIYIIVFINEPCIFPIDESDEIPVFIWSSIVIRIEKIWCMFDRYPRISYSTESYINIHIYIYISKRRQFVVITVLFWKSPTMILNIYFISYRHNERRILTSLCMRDMIPSRYILYPLYKISILTHKRDHTCVCTIYYRSIHLPIDRSMYIEK